MPETMLRRFENHKPGSYLHKTPEDKKNGNFMKNGKNAFLFPTLVI